MAESDWKNVQYKNGKMRTSEGGGGGSSTFSELDDVSLTNLQNGQVPKYNSTTQKWENKEDSLANLSDVSMLSFSDKQVLSYNGRTQKWENRSNSVSRLSDVSLNSPSDGDILRYNAQSGEWENAVMPDAYHAYSTSEQIVGEWIDGKPLYEKTWEFDSAVSIASNSWTDVPISNSTIKGIIGVKGYNLFSGKISCWNGLSATADSGNYVKILHSRNVSITVKYLMLQYTKTTD
jgi:hypothetical protein